MKLKLVNDQRYTEPFIRYLTKAVKAEIIANKNVRKLIPFGEMLDRLDIKATPNIVIEKALKEIKYRKIESADEVGYEIYLNEDAMFDAKYKIIDLIKLLENGNMELNGYPLFTDAFKKIKEEINDQYKLYQFGMGLIYEHLPL